MSSSLRIDDVKSRYQESNFVQRHWCTACLSSCQVWIFQLLQFSKSSCIMCVQYCGGVQYCVAYHEYQGGISWVLWGISWVPGGDIMSTVGDILSTVGRYHDKCGGYLEYRGDIMMHVGKYHEYHGGICGISWVPWGVQHHGVLK